MAAGEVHESAATRALAGEHVVYEWCQESGGATVWIQTSLAPVRDRSGAVVAAIGVGRDITARAVQEGALRRERDLVARIAETSPDGIVTVDRSGQIVFANACAEEVLGLSRDEISGLTYNAPEWRITDYSGGEFADEDLPFSRVMASERPVFDVGHAIEWPDGRRVLLLVNAAPLHDEEGQVSGMVATVRDVTERVRAEQDLLFTNRLLTSINRVQAGFISAREPDRFFFELLQEFLAITESEFGFIGQVLTDADEPYLKTRARILRRSVFNLKSGLSLRAIEDLGAGHQVTDLIDIGFRRQKCSHNFSLI